MGHSDDDIQAIVLETLNLLYNTIIDKINQLLHCSKRFET